MPFVPRLNRERAAPPLVKRDDPGEPEGTKLGKEPACPLTVYSAVRSDNALQLTVSWMHVKCSWSGPAPWCFKVVHLATGQGRENPLLPPAAPQGAQV